MDKKLVKKLYDMTVRNEHITSGKALAEHAKMDGAYVSKIMRNYSHIRDQIRRNRAKGNVDLFNWVMSMWPVTGQNR
jgi:hypothetical protein